MLSATLPLVALACLATFVGLLTSFVASRGATGRRVIQAITAGVLLGLLADILLRLTAAAGLGTALLVRVAPTSLKAPLAVAGPYAIEGLAAAVLLVTFALSMQTARDDPASVTAASRQAVLVLGLGAYELVHGLTTTARGAPLTSSVGADLLIGLALMQASRGAAIGGALIHANVGVGGLLLVALLIGPLGLIGASAGQAVPLEMSGALAAPMLLLAAVVLVLVLSRLLHQVSEPAERGPGQIGGFLVGMLGTLIALRLVSPL